MLLPEEFLTPCKERGFDFFTAVPCSFLTPIINAVISDHGLDYVGAASEGEAVAIASGAWLAGHKTVVMCQNSGLGNAVNPLTSLNYPFKIPTLLITTWRGQPGIKDEPQHQLMGQITAQILETMKIPFGPFPKEASQVEAALDHASMTMSGTNLPFAFIMEKGSVADNPLDQAPRQKKNEGTLCNLTTGDQGDKRPTRASVLECFLRLVSPEAAVIATTGKSGRELFTLDDRKQHLYQVGSMGCASAMGLGLALNTKRQVIVLDGDGAALMKMGSLATIGAQSPAGFLHLLLDNGVHDSTGGQATASSGVDFAKIALACGYKQAFSCDDLKGFETAFTQAQEKPGPTLIHMRMTPGSMSPLGRPTVTPQNVAQRFKDFIARG